MELTELIREARSGSKPAADRLFTLVYDDLHRLAARQLQPFGGMATTSGPVLGTFALLLVEDLLAGWTQHWQVILGPLLILSVIFFRRGLAGIFYKPDA